MSHYLAFLPLEIQTSIAELRSFGTPDGVIDLLIERIFKASEAKTTSLQMDIVRIEDSINARLERIGAKLAADLLTQHGATNAMLVEVRQAQMDAHPHITELQKTFGEMEQWSARIESVFTEAFDQAAAERAKLWSKVEEIDGRLAAVEQALDITTDAPPNA